MGATMVLGPSLRQAIVPAHLMGRVASTSRMLAMCAAPFGAFLGGWLATAYDVRTPLYAAAGLLLTMTAVTATMTSNRRLRPRCVPPPRPMIQNTRNPGIACRRVPVRARRGRRARAEPSSTSPRLRPWSFGRLASTGRNEWPDGPDRHGDHERAVAGLATALRAGALTMTRSPGKPVDGERPARQRSQGLP